MWSLFRSSCEYRPLWRVFGIIATATLLSCSSDGDPTEPEVTQSQPPVSLSISPNSATLLIGEVAYLSLFAYDAQGHVLTVAAEWTSADPAVASVGRTSANVTAIGVGSTTITASSHGLTATATITVIAYHPAARILIDATDELFVFIGTGQRLTARAVDADGHFTTAPIEWSSQDPSIATISRADGQVSGIAVGSTQLVATSGVARSTLAVQVVPPNFLMQWASSATSSSEYSSDDWSAKQATGAPNVMSCNDEAKAWASTAPNLDWLELQYQTPVRPSEIRIYEVYGPGAIVKVEVKDLSGTYHTVYTASPALHNGCLRTLSIPVTTFSEPVTAIRLTLDQRTYGEWNEIDAVRLSGLRAN